MARRAVLLVLALVAAVAVGGCGGGAGSGAGGSAGGLRALVERKPAERKPAPSLSGDLLGGGRFDPSSVRGKVLVVNFWASWCAPCRAEAAELERVYQETKAKGVSFLGINVSDGRDAALAFERGRTTYPSIFDPAGRTGLEWDVPPSSIPATLIVDRTGKLAVVIRGAVTEASLRPIVERIAGEGTGG